MRPRKGDPVVYIPITFDANNKGRLIEAGKKGWIIVFSAIWLFITILSIIAAEGILKLIIPVVFFIVIELILRFIILKEVYYKKKRRELIKNNYVYDYNTFWDVYETSEGYPTVLSYANGTKAIFVMFDKNVIIGKPIGDDYYHYEAIANAIKEATKRRIEIMHIDSMETVGKDDRMEALFKSTEPIRNDDLRKVIIDVYDNVSSSMDNYYASYDIYAFYFKGRDDIFWDELQGILKEFRRANYIRDRVLDEDEINKLVKPVLNIDNFSVRKAMDNIFEGNSAFDYIKPIWVMKGHEKTILNKTAEEMQEIKRISKAEKRLKKGKLFKSKKKKIEEQEDDIEIF
ncbi:hypothetical protein D3C81_10310 [compost metagenome]